jgi:hypothetical protein
MNKVARLFVRSVSTAVVSLSLVLTSSMQVSANEADAKKILKGMSDYLASQQSISFDYDASFEIVTKEAQKLALVSSGKVAIERPNKIFTSRQGGFADVELSYDGETLTLLGKNLNFYSQVGISGSISNLVDQLRDKFNRPLPAADILLPNAYESLMDGVVDVKDLGSGVVGGIECDYLAFRKKNIDWQIWIAHGKNPYPLRYSITSKLISGSPQYTIVTSNWKTGADVATTDFGFKNSTKAKKIDIKDLKGTDDLPEHFKQGASK